MQKETVTFDKLPEAVGYLTEQDHRVEKNGIGTSTARIRQTRVG